jgi:hypothetical protein
MRIIYNYDNFCEDTFHPTQPITKIYKPYINGWLVSFKIAVFLNRHAPVRTPSLKPENTKDLLDEY